MKHQLDNILFPKNGENLLYQLENNDGDYGLKK